MARAPEQTPYSPAEIWAFNGTPLQSSVGAWNISTMGGSRFGIPTYRGQNVQVPYRAGQSQVAKYPDQRTVTLTMWTSGQGDAVANSYPAADQHLAWNNNMQKLRQLFYTRTVNGSVQGQLQRNWYLTQGGSSHLVTSTAMAEIAGSMDLTMNGRTSAAFSVDLLLADPYFYGTTVTQACTGGSTTVSNPGEGIVGEGWPSAVSAFTITLSAAAQVQNVSAGISLTVASGPSFPVTVDILNNTVIDSGGNSVPAKFSHTGSRLWMALQPGNSLISVSAGTATFSFNPPYT